MKTIIDFIKEFSILEVSIMSFYIMGVIGLGIFIILTKPSNNE